MKIIQIFLLVIIISCVSYQIKDCDAGTGGYADQAAHAKLVQKIESQWMLISKAIKLEEQKKFDEAKLIYERLYNEWATSSIQGMAEVGLINVYEELGLYRDALTLVDHMLLVNKIPETVSKYQVARQRLFRKVETQKRESNQNTKP